MKKVCVYCSASDALDDIYFVDAKKLGELLGKNGYDLVYGGSDFGLMGTVANAAKQNGSRVCGIMPQKMYELIKNKGKSCDEFVLTDSMRERKDKLDKFSDITVALPGGFGTLEEISEIIVQKILGYTTKPIVFLNTNHFYDKLFDVFNQFIENRFANKKALNSYYVAKTPEEVIQYISNYVPNEKPKTIEDIYVK